MQVLIYRSIHYHYNDVCNGNVSLSL